MINRIIFACIASVCFGGELFENIPEIKFDSNRAILGKELYFDAGLGGGNSCDSCHNLYFNTSGTSAKIINGINPPTILNSATKKFFYKNGEILNPNGSVESIAGICDKSKRIFGLMPHPERACEQILGSDDGLKMLKGLIC